MPSYPPYFYRSGIYPNKSVKVEKIIVYISGGSDRQSIRTSGRGNMLSKRTLANFFRHRYFRKGKKWYKIVIQASPNKRDTQWVILPNNVWEPSDTTRRKVGSDFNPSHYIHWVAFKQKFGIHNSSFRQFLDNA